MSMQFERTGPLTERTSYPQWAQEMIAARADQGARSRSRDLEDDDESRV